MADFDDSLTISEILIHAVSRRGNERALGFIRAGQLQWRTWREVCDDAMRLTMSIQSAGIEAGDCVAHVSENRYEWIVTDVALHLAGAVHVPIHVTLSGEQIAEQILDCEARLVFVSSRELLSKVIERLPRGINFFIHDEQGERHAETLLDKPAVAPNFPAPNPQPPVPSPQPPAPDSLATILYTSGTTGRPRGVMLSHRNLATNAAAVCQAHAVDAEHTLLCILPLSHIYARTCDLYTWVCSGSRLVLAESRDTLLRDCQLAKPTALNAVPFVYQRIMEGVRRESVGDEAAGLRAALGGRIEILFCGGAPLAPDVEVWYAKRGLPILPGYGLTEASPVIAVNTRGASRAGTVGPALPGVEVRIADDGEVLTRGPNVMLGYWRNGDATNEVIRDGWLHTGDLGSIDADGFLSIRGRKKELIVLSTGKKVVPTRVESLLTASPLIEQAAVFGDGQCGLVALIVPADRSKQRATNDETFEAEIERCLASAAHEEQIHRFVLLDRPFSIERGELTAKLSLCRTVIARHFASELNEG